MNSLGTWVMYDAMMDAAMMSTLMANHNYYYDRPMAVAPGTVAVRTGPSGAVIFLGILGVIVVVGGILIFVSRPGM
jgi:hypothetical protein